MAHSYNIYGYGHILNDRTHRQDYREALRQTITPETVVLDIGSGPGIFALLACQFGARRVYAIEPADIIQVARDLAAANGYADRIEFIQALSTRVTLPEQVQVIVSDLHGLLPLFEQAIPSIVDARRRFLAPGGILIPSQETLWAAVATTPKVYQDFTAPWDDNGYGLDMRVARQLMLNSWRRAQVKPEQLLGEPQCWHTLDYVTVKSPNVSGAVAWVIDRPGTAHGLVLWYDSLLTDSVSYSNAPGLPETVYGIGFFPWIEPVKLKMGDVVSVELSANLVGEDYIWGWDTQVQDPSGQLKADFRQSTFYSISIAPGGLGQIAAGYVPELSEEGRIDSFILALMNGALSLGEIARQVARQFPQRFANEKEALTRAGELSLKYGRPLDNKYLRDT
jgi:protein arginine N-methyltransferase 1